MNKYLYIYIHIYIHIHIYIYIYIYSHIDKLSVIRVPFTANEYDI